MQPTPSDNARLPLRRGDFDTLVEALDYAARGETGVNIYSARGELTHSITYAELRERALDWAARLAGLGVEAGDPVMLLADTTVEFFAGFLACAYRGALPAPAPIPVIFGEREDYLDGLRRRVQTSRATAAIGPTALAPMLQEAVGGLGLRFSGSFEDLAAAPARPHAAARPRLEDLAYLQFSSGSTRHPKGVEVTQRALMNNARLICSSGLDRRPGDRCTSWLPMYHDMGLVGFFLTPLVCQLSVDYLTTRDFARRPMTWLQLIARNRGTLAYSPTFGYELCVKHAERAGAGAGLDLSSWRAAGIGGDMVRPQVLADFVAKFAASGFRREAFVPSYGLAEVTLAVSFAQLDRGPKLYSLSRAALDEGRVEFLDGADEAARPFVGCGRVLPEHELELRDEDGAPTPPGRIGRVFVRGPSLMRGYAHDPEETAQALVEGGWLDTGDLGFMKEGELVVTGRAKDLILINGRNIWPQDIEWAVEALPQLRRGDAAAFAVDDGSGERVVVLVQCRQSNPAERRALQADVEAALKRMGLSDPTVELVPPGALPQTSSGKLSRARAKSNFLAGRYDRGEADAASAARAGQA